jgi:hypothetical protein
MVESVCPVFVRAITTGISTHSNRAALQDWIEFLLFCIPHFRNLFKQALVPITKIILVEISKYKDVIPYSSSRRESANPTSYPISSRSMEADILVLLYAVEKLLAFSFDTATMLMHSPEKYGKSLSEYTRLILRDGEFVEATVIQSVCLELLNESVSVVYGLYSCLMPARLDLPISSGRDNIVIRIEYRITKLFEELYALRPSILIETVIGVWKSLNPPSKNVLVFLELVGDCTNQAILACAFDALRARLPGSSKAKLVRKLYAFLLLIAFRSDQDLLSFLEWFLQHIADADSIIEMWPLFIGYLREAFPLSQSLKLSFLSQLRYFRISHEI